MSGASERHINLALFLASRQGYVTAEECRSAGIGYPDGQDEAAFLRMFERDKDLLRSTGLTIAVSLADGTEAYSIDPLTTFAAPFELSRTDLAALRTVASAFADDTDFPFRQDLTFSLAKLETAGEYEAAASMETVRSACGTNNDSSRLLAEAVRTRKTVTFTYTNASGITKTRRVDPYGLHLRNGCWYLTGHDDTNDTIRTFSLRRMTDMRVNTSRPRTPDFERPASFDIHDYGRLPFQYGGPPVTASLRFTPSHAWRAPRLALGHGTIETATDGSALWHVDVADLARLAAWIIDNGPGIIPVDPPDLLAILADRMHSVVTSHG